jgi:integrase
VGQRRGQGDGSLFKRSDGYWIGQVSITDAAGKRRRKTVSSRDRNTAMKKLKDLQRRIDTGHIPETTRYTVAAWCEKWLRDIRGPVIRPGSLVSYEKSVRRIVSMIGARRVDKLTAEDVRRMVKHLQETKSDRVAQQAWVILRMALKDAVKNEIVFRNVCDATYKPGHDPAVGKALTFEEAQKLMALADASLDDMGALRVAMAIWTGTRPAELLGLRWNYVDLEVGTMRLEWQLQRLNKRHGCVDGPGKPDRYPCGRVKPSWCPQARWDVPPGFRMQECVGSLAFTPPKTQGGVRVVPLIEPLRLLLTSLRSTDTAPNPHNLVFHEPNGRPVRPERDWRMWRQLLDDAGLDASRYVSRGTTATLLLEAGVPEEVRMAIMGHSSVAAHRAYIHVDQAPKLRALETLTGLRPLG